MSRSTIGQTVQVLRRIRCQRAARQRAARIPASTPAFVHSHGKVGSSTIAATLRAALGDREPVFQTHVLSEQRRNKARRKYAMSQRAGPRNHFILSEAIAPYLSALPFPCHVVSATRNPVERAISHAFQTLRSWAPHAQGLALDALTELVRGRVDLLLSPDADLSDPANWFDTEIAGVFGVDVFQRPYDFERGYVLYERGPVRVLVIRMEDFNRSLNPALSELIGIPVPAITRRSNLGSARWYGPALKEVKRTYQPSAEQAERIIAGRYYQHFYAADPAAG